MTLGDIIKEYRIDHGMNIRDFAAVSGLSRAYVSLLERNINPKTGKEIMPSVEVIKKVADAVGKSFDEVFNSIDRTAKIIVGSNTISAYQKLIEPSIPIMIEEAIAQAGREPAPTPNTYCTEHEIKVLDAYREHTEMQPAVDKLLGVAPEQPEHLMPVAAHNDNPDKDQQELMKKDLDKF